jgi:hypothetical protein
MPAGNGRRGRRLSLWSTLATTWNSVSFFAAANTNARARNIFPSERIDAVHREHEVVGKEAAFGIKVQFNQPLDHIHRCIVAPKVAVERFLALTSASSHQGDCFCGHASYQPQRRYWVAEVIGGITVEGKAEA